MRATRTITSIATAPASDRQWLPGLPHVALAVATWPVFGGPACIVGLLMASLVTFVVYLPLTALTLNHGQPLAADAPPPALTLGAQAVLLSLWTLTAWMAAGLS